MRKSVVLGLVPALLVAGATVAGAASDAGPPGGRTVINVHPHLTTRALLDLGAQGNSPGDESFVKDDLTTPADVPVGYMNRQCTSNVPSDDAEMDGLCHGVIVLTGRGKIFYQFSFAEPRPPPPPPPPRAGTSVEPFVGSFGDPWAIVGGTQEFRNARGEITQNFGLGFLRILLAP